MKIEQIRIKNFRAFKDITMKDIPRFAVIIGSNGSGKSTLFSVFGFLRDAMSSNVTTALTKLGGNRGFKEVSSRNTAGAIEIEIKFRPKPDKQLMTYTLNISEEKMASLWLNVKCLNIVAEGEGNLGIFLIFPKARARQLLMKWMK